MVCFQNVELQYNMFAPVCTPIICNVVLKREIFFAELSEQIVSDKFVTSGD